MISGRFEDTVNIQKIIGLLIDANNRMPLGKSGRSYRINSYRAFCFKSPRHWIVHHISNIKSSLKVSARREEIVHAIAWAGELRPKTYGIIGINIVWRWRN